MFTVATVAVIAIAVVIATVAVDMNVLCEEL